jgi:hypothetical protein
MLRRTLRSRSSGTIAVASLLFLGSATGMQGAAITTAAGLVTGVWTDQFSNNNSAFTSSYGFNSAFGVNNPLVQSGSTTGGNSYLSSSFSGYATSAADLGLLHVTAGGTLTNQSSSQSNSTFAAKAVAHFADTLTITSPSVGTGQLGYMSLDITVDGMNIWSSNAYANTYLDVKIGNNSYETLGANFGNNVNGLATLTTGLRPIAYGQVNIIIDLYTIVSVCVPCTGTLGGVIQASSDFSNTAKLTGALFQDSNHVSVPTTVSGDPGFNYSTFAPSSSVPEPETLALVTMGIAGIALFRRRTWKSRATGVQSQS